MRFLLAAFLALASISAFAQVPDKFLEVSPGIYRSAQPDLESLTELQAKYGIKTVINLNNDEETMADELVWVKRLGLNLVSEPMSGFWAPSDQQVDEILAAMVNPHNQPVLLHCQHGEDRTGLLVGLHRVLHEQWTPERAYDEMLDRGFHTILMGLDDYFHTRTGWSFALPIMARTRQ